MPTREWVEVELPVRDRRGNPVVDSTGAPVMEMSRVVRWEVFRYWKQRTLVAFLAVVAAATGAAYLGWAAGRSSDTGLAKNARVAVQSSCEDRADGRITTALGFDQLRFAAITQRPKTQRQRREVERFLHATQGPINDLLDQAAFGSGPKHGETPIHTEGALTTAHRKGRVTEDPELRRARKLATIRCARSALKFNVHTALG